MHGCMYACLHVCMYACMHACMYVCMHICMYACMYGCMYMCICVYVCMSVYACICVYTCVCICMYVCIDSWLPHSTKARASCSARCLRTDVLHCAATFCNQLEKLDNDTRIFPGHDYLVNNLKFTLDREPDNETARTMLARHADQDPNQALVTTLATERLVNTFFAWITQQSLQDCGISFRRSGTTPMRGPCS